jgi:hypothetical protein
MLVVPKGPALTEGPAIVERIINLPDTTNIETHAT